MRCRMTRLAEILFDPAILRPLFWVLLALALFFAFDPRPPALPLDRLGDKAEHMLAFAALTGTAMLGWPRVSAWRLALALVLLGAAIELVQAIPLVDRDSDWRDWAADSVAIVAATALARGLLIRFAPRPPLP